MCLQEKYTKKLQTGSEPRRKKQKGIVENQLQTYEMSVQVMNQELEKEQMNALISIKACYIERILNGSKNTNSEKANPENRSKSFLFMSLPLFRKYFTPLCLERL